MKLSWKTPFRLWMAFAKILNRVMTTLWMAVLFYLIFTPIAVALRLLKIDILEKRLEKSAPSYYRKRESQPGSMKFPF